MRNAVLFLMVLLVISCEVVDVDDVSETSITYSIQNESKDQIEFIRIIDILWGNVLPGSITDAESTVGDLPKEIEIKIGGVEFCCQINPKKIDDQSYTAVVNDCDGHYSICFELKD